MTPRERDDTDTLRSPATLEEVQAHASGHQVGQSETTLERNADAQTSRRPRVDTDDDAPAGEDEPPQDERDD